MTKKILTSAFAAALSLGSFATAQTSAVGVAPADDPDAKYAATLLKPGTAAPDFALATPSGDTLHLADFRGHYVVLDFWASWCPDCRRDAPTIVQLHKQYAERGVKFLGVSFDTDREAWTKAIADFGITYSQVSPLQKWKTTDIYRAYGVEWIPSLYLIDPEGRVALATVVSSKIADALARLSPTCPEEGEAPAADIRGGEL